MTGTVDDYLAYVASKVGIAEQPLGSNHTPIGVEFGEDRVAWCCEFQSLALFHTFGERILWTAGVADAKAQAQRGVNGMVWLPRDHPDIRAGDLVLYDFGPIHGRHGNPSDFHIAGVVNPGTQSHFETIGGNESDSVRRQWRDRTYVIGFIRPPYAGPGLGLPPVSTPTVNPAPWRNDHMFTLVVRAGDPKKIVWLVSPMSRRWMPTLTTIDHWRRKLKDWGVSDGDLQIHDNWDAVDVDTLQLVGPDPEIPATWPQSVIDAVKAVK